MREKRKHMRLPNGFGSITKISDKHLRNPYYARVTVGKTAEGKPIVKSLKPAYYATYNDAYTALLEYHKDPHSLDNSITMEELYNKWSPGYFKNITVPAQRTYKMTWRYCGAIKSMRVEDVRVRHLKIAIEEGVVRTEDGKEKKASPNIKRRMKSLFNLMLDYALEYEIVTINYARSFELSSSVSKQAKSEYVGHIAFTKDELHTLWQHKDEPYVDMILVDCYMGWRPQELCSIETKNINPGNYCITGGMKTDAGKNRIVPILPFIRDIIEKHYNKESKYLFLNKYNKRVQYYYYSEQFHRVMNELGLNPQHKPHDCRKTFITLCKNAGVNDYAIKMMVGHAIQDLTEGVYTERSETFLITEISKVSKY